MVQLSKCSHSIVKSISLCFFIALLGGCATKNIDYLNQPPASWPSYQSELHAIQKWHLIGRIAISTPEESFTANMVWKRTQNAQMINIYNSLGNSYLKLSEERINGQNTVILNLRDHPPVRGNNIQQVLAQVTDWPLPIHLLDYWIRGLNLPKFESGNKKTTIYFNQDGQIAKQTYDHWIIDYKRYSQFRDKTMPKRMQLTFKDFKMKLSIRKWFK